MTARRVVMTARRVVMTARALALLEAGGGSIVAEGRGGERGVGMPRVGGCRWWGGCPRGVSESRRCVDCPPPCLDCPPRRHDFSPRAAWCASPRVDMTARRGAWRRAWCGVSSCPVDVYGRIVCWCCVALCLVLGILPACLPPRLPAALPRLPAACRLASPARLALPLR